MSVFSGKCDLADHIFGMGGYYDKDGNSVKFGQEGVGCFYSDELRDFEAFKKQTNGVIYQHRNIPQVTRDNQEFVKEHCPHFDFIMHVNYIPDKRIKSGYKKQISYTYEYWGKEYTQKELKKKGGVYITVEIHFETLLDIIKYYPYIVCFSCGDAVVISNESYVDEHYQSALECGYNTRKQYEDKRLADHYKDVCKNYILYKLEERTKIIPLDLNKMECPLLDPVPGEECDPEEERFYEMYLPDHVDYNHPIEYIWDDGKLHTHWTSPKLINNESGIYNHGVISLSSKDVEGYLKEDIEKGTVKIKYVAYPEDGFPIHLD